MIPEIRGEGGTPAKSKKTGSSHVRENRQILRIGKMTR